MTRITWSSDGNRYFEAGVDRGVLYVGTDPGVPWVGLISVDENTTGGKERSYFLDGVKYMMLSSAENFEASITAFTYPNKFLECDGTATARPGLLVAQQRRKHFGLSYRVRVGNDTEGIDHGYKIHLIYGAMAEPSRRNNQTFSDSPEPADFSWNISTLPPATSGFRRSSHLIIDSRDMNAEALAAIEAILYGSEEETPRIPTLDELIDLYDSYEAITVTDAGGGIFTISGPDDQIQDLGSGTYQITGDEVVEIDPDTYSITS